MSEEKYVPTKQVQLLRFQWQNGWPIQELKERLKDVDVEGAYLEWDTVEDWDGYPESYFAVYVDVPQTPEEIEADYKSFEEDIINQIAGLQHRLKQLKEEKEMVIG